MGFRCWAAASYVGKLDLNLAIVMPAQASGSKSISYMQARTFRGTFNQLHFFRQHHNDVPFSTHGDLTAKGLGPVKRLRDQDLWKVDAARLRCLSACRIEVCTCRVIRRGVRLC